MILFWPKSLCDGLTGFNLVVVNCLCHRWFLSLISQAGLWATLVEPFRKKNGESMISSFFFYLPCIKNAIIIMYRNHYEKSEEFQITIFTQGYIHKAVQPFITLALLPWFDLWKILPWKESFMIGIQSIETMLSLVSPGLAWTKSMKGKYDHHDPQYTWIYTPITPSTPWNWHIHWPEPVTICLDRESFPNEHEAASVRHSHGLEASRSVS